MLLLAALLACAPPEPAAPAAPAWPGDDRRPPLTHPFFAQHPGLSDLSLYANRVEGPLDERPDQAHRGAFAVGNGRAFALQGLTDPLNTLHGLTGPVYERGDRFFGDQAVRLVVDGEEPITDREWIARVRGSAVDVTRAEAGGLVLSTVDFAARPADSDDLTVPAVIVRVLLVENGDAAAHDVALRIDPYRAPEVQDGLLTESDGAHVLALLPWEGDLDPDTLTIPLGVLAPGGSARAVLALGFGEDAAAIEALPVGDADSLLEDTLAWWADFSAEGVLVSTADPRIDDLYDAWRVGVRVQQSAAGAVCPMSRYTGVWLRDTIGPVRFLLRAGLQSEAAAALDYLHLCHAVAGDYGNACSSGLEPGDLVGEPDWAALGPFSGRLAAEGPSYVPLGWLLLARFSGDWQPIAAHWDYLSRALLAQQITADGLQPFSGDETFRIAMAAALGHPLDEAYEESAWSANSSFLMLAAARGMAEAAAQIGADPAPFEALAALAEGALQERFRLTDGGWSPLIWRTTSEPEPQPFEDVNLQPLWLGTHAPDDAGALANLAVLREAAGQGDGTIQTLLPEPYEDFGIEEGMCTGMVPGYYLANLVAVGDAEAGAAFDALHRYADDGGQVDEYMVYDDLSALAPLYDASGMLGDFTARYRPWEGAIDADAMLLYLAGPVAGEEADLVLAPHLPSGHRRLELAGLRAGAGLADLALSWEGPTLTVRVASRAERSFTVVLDLPLPWEFGPPSAWEPAGTLHLLPGGERRVRFEAVEVGPSAEVEFTVRGV